MICFTCPECATALKVTDASAGMADAHRLLKKVGLKKLSDAGTAEIQAVCKGMTDDRVLFDDKPFSDVVMAARGPLSDWAALRGANSPAGELKSLRHSLARGTPFGDAHWQTKTAGRLGLESSLRP